jgi:predicted GIY-YIG superfamily endonuclease
MAWVYILSGESGRYYIGATDNLARRLEEHQRGSNHTTRRIGKNLKVVVTREVFSMTDARKLERNLKRKKNPRLALLFLQTLLRDRSQPRKPSGLVPGSSPGQPSRNMAWVYILSEESGRYYIGATDNLARRRRNWTEVSSARRIRALLAVTDAATESESAPNIFL